MRTAPTIETEFGYGRSLVARGGRVLWSAIRLSIAAVLLLLEPIVGFICGTGLVLGVLAAILFEASAVGPRFPLGIVIAISLSFGAILFLYYALLSILADY